MFYLFIIDRPSDGIRIWASGITFLFAVLLDLLTTRLGSDVTLYLHLNLACTFSCSCYQHRRISRAHVYQRSLEGGWGERTRVDFTSFSGYLTWKTLIMESIDNCLALFFIIHTCEADAARLLLWIAQNTDADDRTVLAESLSQVLLGHLRIQIGEI